MSPFLREIYPALQYDIIIPRGHEVARAFRAYSVQMINCFWSTNVAIIYLLFGARFEYFVAMIPYMFSISYFVGSDMTGYNSLYSRSQIMIISVAMIFIAWASFDNYQTSLLEFIPEILFPASVFSITLLNLLIFEFSGWTYPALKQDGEMQPPEKGVLEKHIDRKTKKAYYYDAFNHRSYWVIPDDLEYSEIVDFTGQT